MQLVEKKKEDDVFIKLVNISDLPCFCIRNC
jgi:hypothetical protein